MKKHLIQLITLTLLTVLLTACGGGGGGDTPAITQCEGADQGYAKAKTLPADQPITKTTPTATLRIWHTAEGTRKACIISGEVHEE